MLEVVEEPRVENEELLLAVLLLLNTMQALLGSAAVVLEVKREDLELLVEVLLLVIAVEILLTQATLLILAGLDSWLLAKTVLVALAVLVVNGNYLELALHAVVAELALLTGICVTLTLLLLLILSLPLLELGLGVNQPKTVECLTVMCQMISEVS